MTASGIARARSTYLLHLKVLTGDGGSLSAPDLLVSRHGIDRARDD
ncbi:MAG: hypothetical protein O2992_09375 [Gemmatimonadetes bacterium]|nr:hypothetical protein [Gemmatimonadota bacterium]